eukprot:GHVU01142925.1.p2 GENE.GHVU01142925.1~~GHVU01142925.1.p2  ORF type:complete len:108 (-),score=4.89 GHVU01142925.1:84-407(-)
MMNAQTPTHAHAHTHTHTHTRANTHTHANTHTCAHARAHIDLRTHRRTDAPHARASIPAPLRSNQRPRQLSAVLVSVAATRGACLPVLREEHPDRMLRRSVSSWLTQ